MTKSLCKEGGERRRGDLQKIFMANFADCPILGTVSLLFFPCTVPLTFRNHQQGCRVSCRSSFCMPNTVSFGPPALPLLFCRPVVYLFVFFRLSALSVDCSLCGLQVSREESAAHPPPTLSSGRLKYDNKLDNPNLMYKLKYL